MKLKVGHGSPVELEGRPCRVKLRRSAIHAAEDIELVVMEVHRYWIVGLKGRPLHPEPGDGEEQEQKEKQPCAASANLHRLSYVGE